MFRKIFSFFDQVKQEINKVVWPTKHETVSTAIMIVLFSVLSSLFFFVVDRFFMWLMNFIF